MKKTLSLFLVLALLLGLGTGAAAGGEEITDLVTYETQAREMENFNYQYCQNSTDINILTNCIDVLLTNNRYGALVPCLAETYETKDGGENWVFHLRKGVKWVDIHAEEQAETIAEDFLWGLEWVLNFHKNDGANVSMPSEMIKGAAEYYAYTKNLSMEEGMKLGLGKFLEMVDIKAADDYTLEIGCPAQLPYFSTLATYNCLAPISGKLLEKIGAEGYRSLTHETMWYNGPYILTTFIHQNEKVLTKNPKYWNTEAKRFNTVTIKMVSDQEMAFQLFQTGELHNVTLNESVLKTIYENKDHELHGYLSEGRPQSRSYQFHLIFDKKLENGEPDVNWNTAIANEAFRLSWYYGLDFVPVLRRVNSIHPISCANYAYTIGNLVLTSDGKDYRDLVLEKIGITPDPEKYVRYQPEKGAQYKEQAMRELTEKGVAFPIQADYYIKSGDQSALDTAFVIKQMFSDCLGDDYVRLNIKEFVSSRSKEVYQPQLASFGIAGWMADFGDPVNYLGQQTYGEDNAFYSISVNKVNGATDEGLIAAMKTYTELVHKAAAITDNNDARYAAFAEAEAFLLNHALVIPFQVIVPWQISCINEYSKIYSPYGSQSPRYIGWETKAEGYTTEEAAQNLQDYLNNAK